MILPTCHHVLYVLFSPILSWSNQYWLILQQTCRNSTVACDSSNIISCMCSDVDYLSNLQGCFALACSPKDVFSAINVTSITCNMPVRSKTRVYKIVDIVFFGLATVAIFGRFAAHITVGRMQWLNDGNMGLVLVSWKALTGALLSDDL